jgi:hypothetical protein
MKPPFYQHRYRIDSDGRTASVSVDGREIRTSPCGVRLVADPEGRVLYSVPIEKGMESR